MSILRNVLLGVLVLAIAAVQGGCETKEGPKDGFLSDYSMLEVSAPGQMTYVSPRLGYIGSIILSPVRVLTAANNVTLTDAQRKQVQRYFNDRLERVLRDNDYIVLYAKAVGGGRFRIGFTDIEQDPWWQARGGAAAPPSNGAAMEGEIVNSLTGEQVMAFVRTGFREEFGLTEFSSIDEVKATIDLWAEEAERNLSELRSRLPRR